MSKSFLETYNSIRKPICKGTKIMSNPKKEYTRKWDWKKELNNDKE